jgi:aspartyl protease family protein
MRAAFILPFVILTLCAAAPAHAGSATLTRAKDGHFWAQAKINGRPARMLVDTGASTVALTLADAKRARVEVDTLRFTVPVDTAGGRVMAARVVLTDVAVGTAEVPRVDALVFKSSLKTSVIGMSYLRRLSRMDVRGDEMRLKD